MMIRKWLTKSNLLNGLFFLVLVVFMINPTAKVFLIRGLMKAGLFQPDLSGRTVSTNNIALPNLVFYDSNGTTINLAELKGKVVFINFWATWCPPCIAEMPSINELYQKLKNNKDIIFITVDVDHNFQKSKAFMVKHRLALPLYQAVNPIPSDLLGNAIPTTVIFDKAGQIVYHHEGQADYSNPRVAEYLVKIAK